MRPELKEFYKLQYQWIRMPHPSRRVAVDKKHPLHQIELEVSHAEPIVHNLIRDLLGEEGLFDRRDVERLEETFLHIRSGLDQMEPAEIVAEYKQYLDSTLELLGKAKAVLSEPQR